MKTEKYVQQLREGKKENKPSVAIGHLINQATHELVGGVYTDKNGKIHFVDLVFVNGGWYPDYPDSTTLLDVKQVGIAYK
jgi:hypothetical protein